MSDETTDGTENFEVGKTITYNSETLLVAGFIERMTRRLRELSDAQAILTDLFRRNQHEIERTKLDLDWCNEWASNLAKEQGRTWTVTGTAEAAK